MMGIVLSVLNYIRTGDGGGDSDGFTVLDIE